MRPCAASWLSAALSRSIKPAAEPGRRCSFEPMSVGRHGRKFCWMTVAPNRSRARDQHCRSRASASSNTASAAGLAHAGIESGGRRARIECEQNDIGAEAGERPVTFLQFLQVLAVFRLMDAQPDLPSQGCHPQPGKQVDRGGGAQYCQPYRFRRQARRRGVAKVA